MGVSAPAPATTSGAYRRETLTVAALLLLSVLYFLPFIRVLHRVGDEGTIAYGAQRVLEGAVPYRDFLEIMGPGSFYWLAFFFKIFGDTWQVSRLCLLVTGVASTLLVYWIARQFLSARLALLPWFFCVALSIPLWPAPNHHWDSNLFALCAVACFLQYERRQRDVFLFAGGILAGATSCFLQQKGAYLLLAFAVILLIGRVRILRSISVLLAGYLSAGAVVMFLFYRAGAFAQLIRCTLLWPLFGYKALNAGIYFKSLAVAVDSGSLFFRAFPFDLAILCQALCFLPFLLLIALPLVPAGSGIIAACKPGYRAALWSAGSLTLTLSGLGIWLSEMHRKDVYHLAFGAPLLAIGFVQLVQAVCAKRTRRAILAAMTAALLLVAIGNLWNTRKAYRIETRRGPVMDAVQDDALSFLSTEIPKRDWVFVYPYYPMYYYLADLRNPTRFSILLHHYNTPEHFEEVIRDLESKHVQFVLWDTLVDGANLSTWFAGYTQPARNQLKLEQYLNKSFTLVCIKNGFRVLRRKE